MSEEELVMYVVIVFIVIAGVWLTILSYLVLTKISSKKEEREAQKPVSEKEEEAETEEKKPEEVEVKGK